MIWILIEFAIVIIGLLVTGILFFRFPTLPDISSHHAPFPSVSVIIPARNEEANLPLLLQDLNRQTLPALEIICVDDASEDATASVAIAHNARLIRLKDKPREWTGKTWACQHGADAAKGELLLFLDADVRLGKSGLQSLLQAYQNEGCTISVQPFHKTEKLYEQFSLPFNLVQIAANGTALPKPLNTGLYGPVILISKQDYQKAGGHESIRRSIIEDMALGAQLKKAGLPFRLFVGNPAVSFRMYSGGFRSLLQGWVKNIASGAVKTPLPVFIMVFFWITSLISVPLQVVKFTCTQNWPWLMTYGVLYLVWAVLLAVLSKRVGKFKWYPIIVYPVLTFVWLSVFAVSAFKRIFKRKVKWKGRDIESGDQTCE